MYPSNHLNIKYNAYKHYLQRMSRKVERIITISFFQENKENKNDIVKARQIIKNIINKKTNSSRNQILRTDDEDITDKQGIANILNILNEFYVNIGPTLARNIPPSNCKPLNYINKGIASSCWWKRSSGHIKWYEKFQSWMGLYQSKNSKANWKIFPWTPCTYHKYVYTPWCFSWWTENRQGDTII